MSRPRRRSLRTLRVLGFFSRLRKGNRKSVDRALRPSEREASPARSRPQVDAAVLPEAAVLDGDDRVLHPRVDLIRLDEHAALVPAQAGQDGRAVGRVDEAVLLEGALADRAQLRNLARDRCDEPVNERNAAYEPEDREQSEEAKLANPTCLGFLLSSAKGQPQECRPRSVAFRIRGVPGPEGSRPGDARSRLAQRENVSGDCATIAPASVVPSSYMCAYASRASSYAFS